MSKNNQHTNISHIIDLITFVVVVFLSLRSSATVLGAVRGVVFGFLILYCQSLFSQKRYVALVLAVLIGFLINVVFNVAMQ